MEADRISSLHDSILHHIFSFLPTKDVVQTSILSKRWEKLWISLPYLHFGESGFASKESFIDFVDNALYYHDKSRIFRFQLQNGYASDQSCHTQAWISAAVRAGVQELEVSLPSKVIGRGLPSCLFTCSSLERLKLNIGYVFPFPDKFCFPKLKSMDVCEVIFAKNFTHQLLNSPNLEELFLRDCKIEVNSSPSSHSHDTDQDWIADYHRHSGCFSKLNKAHIGLRDNSGKGNSCICASELIRKLSNVEYLCLENSYIRLLQTESNLLENLPIFRNLKRLGLTLVDTKDGNVGVMDGDVGVMVSLLNCSPVLQSLDISFFKYKLVSGYGKRELKAEEFHTGELKRIDMKLFPGSKNQVELVRVFLANAKVLEKIILHIGSYLEPSLKEELLQFPRLSTSCEVIL